ncbi:hypothetical protein PTSG_12410 [Salpingoeca rosetta]|uniref:D-serine dehydratase-like domain-containing protein n=1 Tax=Salpingoeca rosetta (strain ATCC 50818 / BSB-021) TaxID=946362 RepID=F2UC65_SALR5|nr:uncharacterized protein PTSG_12410 [Salpingoeca rosetta]EGD74172.1 hypothetical protein PTSG_12410 [Salpingoeca rosetta]|eukprot:XP_004993072.1 hypothetical protein PTSG_12410 [Salpingoeca rosetta]
MTALALAEVGTRLALVDTPALVVVQPKLDANLQRMRTALQQFPHITLRPHLKAHKSSYFANAQAAAGVSAWCCQKLQEAEGILPKVPGMRDLLITNEIVGKRKVERLMSLVKEHHARTKITVLVDDVDNCRALNAAMANASLDDAKLHVLAEVDVGQERCGVAPGSEDLVALARVVTEECPHLHWSGIQCYQGKLQHVRNYEEKRQLVNGVAAKADASRTVLEENGFPCPIISGGGTGTFVLEAQAGVHNECQPGSYVFMDVDYSKNLDQSGQLTTDFEHSLFVHTTIMSKPTATRLVVDAGMKAVSLDSGPPIVVALHDDGSFTSCAEEVAWDARGRGKSVVGDTLQLIPGHCDPTVNLYDQYVVIADGVVTALPPIEGRGPGV